MKISKKQQNKKELIISYLKTSINYNEIFEYLVDDFLFNEKTIINAKERIEKEGLTLSCGNGATQQNPAFVALMSLQKANHAIAKKLGLSPADIQTFKTIVKEDDDGFDD